MSALTLPQTNGSRAKTPFPTEAGLSVRSFFAAINWNDTPPEEQPSQPITTPGVTSSEVVDLSIKVSQFFALINWDDTAIAAPATQQTPPSLPPDSLTLDHFSDLF